MTDDNQPKILQSAKDYFSEAVDGAMVKCSVKAPPAVSSYLVELLNHYLVSENLHATEESEQTLAESLLGATQLGDTARKEKLKRLGDMSLYISGFFGDSLKRKLVDIDYYADIGGTAYGSLAAGRSGQWAEAYDLFSRRFLDFVEVLTLISRRSAMQRNSDLLRLYDRYLVTGSKLAKNDLDEHGIITPADLKKAADQ